MSKESVIVKETISIYESIWSIAKQSSWPDAVNFSVNGKVGI